MQMATVKSGLGSMARRISQRFLRGESGAATIEAVLWLPFFVMLFAMLVDVSMIFHGQTRVMRIIQDANRNTSIGRLDTPGDTESFILSRLGGFSPHASAATNITAGLVTTTVSVPLADLDVLGVVSAFSDSKLTVRADHLMEY